jgi:hypothetical protein
MENLITALEEYLSACTPVRVEGSKEDAFVVLCVRDPREVALAEQLLKELKK